MIKVVSGMLLHLNARLLNVNRSAKAIVIKEEGVHGTSKERVKTSPSAPIIKELIMRNAMPKDKESARGALLPMVLCPASRLPAVRSPIKHSV